MSPALADCSPPHLSPGSCCPPGQPHAHKPNHRPSQASGFTPHSDIPAPSCSRKNTVEEGVVGRVSVRPLSSFCLPSHCPLLPGDWRLTVSFPARSPQVQSQPGARLLLLPPSLWSAAPDACLPALPLLLCVPRPPDRPGLAAALQCPLSCWGRRPRLYPQGPVLCAPGLQRGLVSHSGRLTRLCVWGSAACSSTSEPPRSCLATAALSPLLICQSLSWRLGRCLPGYIAAACVSTWSPWAGHTPERKFHIPQLFLGP